MKKVEVTVFEFSELSKKAQEKAISDWRMVYNYDSVDEEIESIKEFCSFFGVNLNSYEIAGCSYSFETNAQNQHFRGLKLSNFNALKLSDHSGFYFDCDLWENFTRHWKSSSSAKRAFDVTLNYGFTRILEQLEYYDSNEYISETLQLNEYLFTEDGCIFKG